ncbi:CPBP family intramembrane metalloprotease [Aceticella autotrophica]|uniref:CPBP family intramembrane metalloprotease n=1 Tax=Aceticella autotrophica TaxID=2755338 RepID=A0A975AW36_9THEO|nr:type II CAAX endopeptidase family protein [Aceticella autotrophica]QSZ27463.1 CPBP family intramembrane metalloprotease [Aceticella autotrophica]
MRPSEKDANKVYFIVLILLITIGAYVQRKSLYSGLVITEFMIVLLPVLLYLCFNRFDIKYVLRFNTIKMKHVILIVGITLCGWFISTFFALLTNLILSKVGHLPLSPIPIAESPYQLMLQIFIISGIAAFCEEILMRGLIMRSYEMRGSLKAIIISALLFSMLHLNIQNFLSILFLGFLLGYVVHRTDSIFAGMIGHFTNNTFTLVMSYIMAHYPKTASAPHVANIAFAVILFYGILVFGSAICLYFLLKLFIKSTNPYIIYSTTPVKEDLEILFHWPLSASILIFIFMITLEIMKIAGITVKLF